jgi:heat-inducible transcriptional repressor
MNAGQLHSRQREVLYSIVETYIETGEPVASRTISKRRRDSLSAASIRNVMADLSEAGFLEQPHTSAGRIPTEKAFRLYVQSLAARRLPSVNLEQFRAGIAEAESISDWVERSSHLLTELTRNVGIAAAIPATCQTLDHIELVKLADRRVLMIVVTRDQIVRDRIVTLVDDISADELLHLRNYLNDNFGGWILQEARRELGHRLEAESAEYDEILRRLMVLYGKGLLDFDSDPECSVEGASNLVGLDLHLTRERMRDLFRALEEKKRMIQLLDRFLENVAGEIGIHVGLGEAHPAMKPLSLIGLNVILPGGMAAKIAVLGPMRMNYDRVISAVLQVSAALSETDL